MADRPWKRCEREVAARLGGRRVPITGRQRGDVPDIKHEWLSVEVKTRKALPTWLKDAVAQAVAAASPTQLPIVVLHQVGERHSRDLVVLPLSEFEAWFGPTDGQKGEVA